MGESTNHSGDDGSATSRKGGPTDLGTSAEPGQPQGGQTWVLSLGEGVVVSNVALAVEMQKLAFYLANAERIGWGVPGVSDRRTNLAAVGGAKR